MEPLMDITSLPEVWAFVLPSGRTVTDWASLPEVWAFGYETIRISPCRDSTDRRPMFSVFAPAIPGIWNRRLLGYAHSVREVLQMVNQHRHWLRAQPPTPPEAA